MANKMKLPNEEQAQYIRKAGRDPDFCEIIKDYSQSMIVKDFSDGLKVVVVEKV